MSLRLPCVMLAILASQSAPALADKGTTQTTISVHANGKPVAGLIFPMGAGIETSMAANRMDGSSKDTRLSGNVQGRITPSAGQSFILFGDEVVISTEAVSAERARAVRDLEAMAGPDQLYRGRAFQGGMTQEEIRQQNAIDASNMKRLAEIIDAYGWPGLRFAGAASQTAFLVLQHADPDSQRKYLPLMREAVQRNDALGSQLALLEDRVRVADGKPQLYGSQLSGTPLRFAPIEDEANVDQRRRSIGMEPMADYAKHFGISYPAPAKDNGAAPP